MANKKKSTKTTKNTVNKNTKKKNTKKSKSKVKNKDKKKKEEPDKYDPNLDSKEIHMAPVNYSIQRAGVEVYETDEENFKRYVSPHNEKASENTNDAEIENEEADSGEGAEEDEEEEEQDAPASAYTLHQGEILNTLYYTNLNSMDFESDYKEMTNEATFTKQELDLKQFYKGVRLKLLSEWEQPFKSIEWTDLNECLLGFITEQTFEEEETEVKVSGMTFLLEQTLEFKFTQMPRAEIIAEILKSAGLNPIINVDGLDNDVIDFTNENSSNTASTGSNTPIGESSGNIAQLAQQVCKGKTTDLAKAQAIHSYIANNIKYPEPNYEDHHKCPTEVVRSGYSNCCDRARLGHEMANAVGLYNRGVHGPGHVWIQYKIGGRWVDSDPNYSRPNLGVVYEGMSMDSEWTFEKC